MRARKHFLSDALRQVAEAYDPAKTEVVNRENKGVTKSKARKVRARPISQADAYEREEREREANEPDTRPDVREEQVKAENAAVPKLWKGHFSND